MAHTRWAMTNWVCVGLGGPDSRAMTPELNPAHRLIGNTPVMDQEDHFDDIARIGSLGGVDEAERSAVLAADGAGQAEDIGAAAFGIVEAFLRRRIEPVE